MLLPPAWVLKLDVPKPTPYPFESVFGSVDQVTLDALKRFSSLRDEVAGALAKSAADAGIMAIERYLPSLRGLMHTVENLPPDTLRGLKISWTTPLFAKYSSSPVTAYNTLKLEWHMIIYSYGILHRNAAMDLSLTMTDSDFDEKSKQVANLLCTAAGIFEFLRGEAGMWLVKPDPLFTELKDDTLVALSSLSLAEAQTFAIKKAVLKATRGKVVAKLCMDVVQKCETAYSLLKSQASAYEPGLMALTTYMQVTMDVFKAIALKCEALEFVTAHQYGSAVGYLRVALATVPEDKSKTIKPLEWLYKEVQVQRNDLQRVSDVHTTDNDKIYFEAVLDAKSVVYPEGRNIMKLVPFSLPPAVVIPVVFKQGTSCIVQ
eukprot:Phypoly_transcript_09520.p1 GENE.Phypoly_transcript_09520~~Phypoly_transcript_09520.p1  ORF type:complete len:375 (+),score=44.07 Phypoly_transcript_09520:156-1280(+)